MCAGKGALFIDYTRRPLAETDPSFGNLVHYIHTNPVHHGYIRHLELWHYSSYKAIISNTPARLLRNELLNWFGGREQFINFHKREFKSNDFFEFD